MHQTLEKYVATWRETAGKLSDHLQAVAAERKACKTPQDVLSFYHRRLQQGLGKLAVRAVPPAHKAEPIIAYLGEAEVVISPHIFAEMRRNPQTESYFLSKISDYYSRIVPKSMDELGKHGISVESTGMVIHDGGSISYLYNCAPAEDAQEHEHRITYLLSEVWADTLAVVTCQGGQAVVWTN